MKLLILGGGNCQLNAIRRARELGHTVIVSDYYRNAPGKECCHYGEMASTFDFKANIKVARKYKIDGILTTGTDQPVYTAARVAGELGLPSLIDIETAKSVTNKKVMKKIFQASGIPTVKFIFLKKGFADQELSGIRFPVVVKPLDSQGQRGVYKLDSIQEVREHVDDVLNYSREEEFLLEEYYQSDEITVSGWIASGRVYLLTVTDRLTFEKDQHIGICTAHNFPSYYLKEYLKEIEEISFKIVEEFNIQNGPIYFQMLIGSEGIQVNEIACRIGGAYEDIFIPYLTGVDILKMAIDSALGLEPVLDNLRNYSLDDNKGWLSVQLFFARPGKIIKMSELNKLRKSPGVIQVGFNFKVGDQIKEIENATQRAGYLVVTGNNRETLEMNLNQAFDQLKIYNTERKNLIINPREGNH